MYAVMFDIDGTLLQTGGAGKVAFAETFQEVFDLEAIPEGITFAGRSDRAISNEIMQVAGIEPSAENWNRFYADYRERLGNALAQCEGYLLPGIVELLDLLDQDPDVAIGLLTGNTEFGAHAKTAAYGLAGRFAFGGYGDECTHRNDIAAVAKVAAEEFAAGMRPAEKLCGTMVIGDTPADVECGRSIGAYVVAVATGGATTEALSECEPDLLLTDLTDTKKLLAEVRAVARP